MPIYPSARFARHLLRVARASRPWWFSSLCWPASQCWTFTLRRACRGISEELGSWWHHRKHHILRGSFPDTAAGCDDQVYSRDFSNLLVLHQLDISSCKRSSDSFSSTNSYLWLSAVSPCRPQLVEMHLSLVLWSFDLPIYDVFVNTPCTE